MDFLEEVHTIGTEIEPLRSNEMGSINFDVEPGEGGLSSLQLSMDLTDSTLKGGFDSSTWFEAEVAPRLMCHTCKTSFLDNQIIFD